MELGESSSSSSGSCTPSTPLSSTALFPCVHTKYGCIEGIRITVNPGTLDHQADLFLGIPYAQPPLGELRLERPKPLEKFPENVYKAKSFGFGSIPLTYLPHNNNYKPVRVSEDCLTLNVFKPAKQCSQTGGYPVLVYIHGGGFCVGSSREYGYKHLCEHFVFYGNGFVLVTIQYRLGPLGLLSDGTDDFAGNYTLWDQAMALQFLHENIEAFNGNPNKITAWGLSAGAASITELSLSPYCRDSIFGTIEMSGTAFAGWAANERLVNVTKQLVEELQKTCATNGSPVKKHCSTNKHLLKSKTVIELQEAVRKIDTACYEVNLLKYQPRIDGQFLPKDFEDLLKESPAKPCLMGITANEALYFTILGKDRVFNRLFIEKEHFHTFHKAKLIKAIEELIAPTHKFQSTEEAKAAQTEIIHFYLGNADPLNDYNWVYYLERYTQILSDLLFNVSIIWMARHRARSGWPTYIYYNEYFNPDQYPDWVPFKASTHANEYPYIHGLFPVGKFKFNQVDCLHQQILLQILCSFANDGAPSLSGLKGSWPCVPATKNKPIVFLKIDSHSELQWGSLPELENTANFWQLFVGKYSYDPVRNITYFQTKKVAKKCQRL